MHEISRKILLNPGPVTTTLTVKQSLLVPDICHREKEFLDVIQDIRSMLLNVAHGDNQNHTAVLFASSGTGAVESVISSVIPRDKKLAIVTNGTYGDRMIEIAKRYALEVVVIDFPYNEKLSLTKIEEHLLNDGTIGALAMVHHETSSGMLNPLHEIGEIANKYHCTLIVDAISSFSGVSIDIMHDKIDYLVASSNKCLQGMPGLAFVICDRKKLNLCKNNSRSYYFDLYHQNDSLDTKGSFLFTPPVQVCYAFKKALLEYLEETESCRIARLHANYSVLVNGLEKLGFSLVLPEECWSKLLALVKLESHKKKFIFEEMHDYLYERGFTIYPSQIAVDNAFRVACIGDLTQSDIEDFLQALGAYMRL